MSHKEIQHSISKHQSIKMNQKEIINMNQHITASLLHFNWFYQINYKKYNLLIFIIFNYILIIPLSKIYKINYLIQHL